MNIFEEYKDKIISIIKKAEKDKLLILPDNLNSVNVDSTPPKIDFDISTNVSMVLAKPNNKSPNDLAVILIDLFKKEDKSIEDTFAFIKQKWGKLDFLVHAIAYSDKEELKGEYVNTTRDNFLRTLDISCYSFTSVAKHAADLMENGGSLLTLSYYGSERVMPHYNVMGVAKAALEASVRYLAEDLGSQNIRVNALSAGPMKTLAASGIGDFRYILKWNEHNSPLRRNVSAKDVGGSGMYLLSDLSSGVTGETHHVDCGYNIVGMKAVDAPDIAVNNDDN